MTKLGLYSVAAALAGFAAIPASAMPVAPLAGESAVTPVTHRVVCDRFGRCWRPAHRVVRRYYVEPDYGYYGYGAYPYAYSYGPSVSFGYPYRRYWAAQASASALAVGKID